ncbi:MAG TPA: hypothetical protein VIS06_01480, partial [Mycobacteriales bacterium]
VVDQTGDQASANKILGDARTALYNAMVQSGLTKDQAKKLVDQYLAIPKSVTTAVNAKTAAAQAKIDEVQRHLGNIRNRTVTINVQTHYVNPGTAVKVPGGVVGDAEGGLVRGPGTSTSDSVPRMLSNGEYVVQASSVSQFGVDFFDALNAGRVSPIVEGRTIRPATTSAPAGGVGGMSDRDITRLAAALGQAGPREVRVTGQLVGRGRDLLAVVTEERFRTVMR